MTISDRLAEIQARVEEATDGPWKVNGPDEDWAVVSSGSDSVFHAYSGHGICEGCECGDGAAHVAIGIEDAEFIAHARTDVPALAASLRAVIELHKPYPDEGMGWREDHTYGYVGIVCATCGTPDEYGVPWPCGTVRAIEAALGEVAP